MVGLSLEQMLQVQEVGAKVALLILLEKEF